MDIRELGFESDTFDVVIDKGLRDCKTKGTTSAHSKVQVPWTR